MPKTSTRRRSKFEIFLKHFNGILDALPSDSEKQEIEAALLKLIQFMNDLKARLQLLPSDEEMSSLRTAAQRLEQALVAAETDPVLAAVFGLARPQARRQRAKAPSEADSAAAKTALEALQPLSIDEIRSKLQSDSYPVATLRAIASLLGVRPTRGLKRDALAHQVAMRIANARGYERLRDEGLGEGSQE